MEKKISLNADIPGSISELQAAMKAFLLKNKLYRILLRGKGLEFETYRNYAPDDDATAIDWKASKRANSLIVKQYRDERNLKIIFILDVGENMVFGSAEKLKCEYAAEVVGAFSHLIITTGDKVGYVLFSNEVKNFVKPSGGTKHFHRLADQLLNPLTYGGVSELNKGLNFALDYLPKSTDSVVVVSDFISFDEKSKKVFSLLSGRFETVAVAVRDNLDRTMPDFSGEIVLEDPATGQQLLVNPEVAKKAYEKFSFEREKSLKEICLRNNVDLLELTTSKPFAPSLSEFLKSRIKKRTRGFGR